MSSSSASFPNPSKITRSSTQPPGSGSSGQADSLASTDQAGGTQADDTTIDATQTGDGQNTADQGVAPTDGNALTDETQNGDVEGGADGTLDDDIELPTTGYHRGTAKDPTTTYNGWTYNTCTNCAYKLKDPTKTYDLRDGDQCIPGDDGAPATGQECRNCEQARLNDEANGTDPKDIQPCSNWRADLCARKEWTPEKLAASKANLKARAAGGNPDQSIDANGDVAGRDELQSPANVENITPGSQDDTSGDDGLADYKPPEGWTQFGSKPGQSNNPGGSNGSGQAGVAGADSTSAAGGQHTSSTAGDTINPATSNTGKIIPGTTLLPDQ